MTTRGKIFGVVSSILAAMVALAAAGVVYLSLRKEPAETPPTPPDPSDITALAPDPPIPPKRNAASVYREAFALMKLPVRGEAEYDAWRDLCRDEAAFDENVDLARRVVSRNAEALALLEKAVAMPECWLHGDLRKYADRPWDIPFPEVNDLRRAQGLVRAAERLALADGHRDEAARRVLVEFGMARAVAKDPFTLSFFVGLALEGDALHDLERLLDSDGELGEVLLRRLAEAAAASYDPGHLALALEGERAVGMSSIRAVGEGRRTFAELLGGGPQPDNPGAKAWLAATAAENVRVFKELMDAYIACARTPFPSRLKEVKAIDKRAMSLRARALDDKKYLSAAAILTPWGRAFSMDAQHLALSRMALAAVELKLARRRNGTFPASLDDLGSERKYALIDPFSGGKLLYRRTPTGYVLWSVGPDGEDDGGKTTEDARAAGDESAKPDWDDVVWRCDREAARGE